MTEVRGVRFLTKRQAAELLDQGGAVANIMICETEEAAAECQEAYDTGELTVLMTKLSDSAATPIKGPRQRITLDIAEKSIEMLLSEEGERAQRVFLRKQEDGSYRLGTWGGTVGDARDKGIEPAADKLVRILNEFADVLDQHEVPQEVSDAWDRACEEWDRRAD